MNIKEFSLTHNQQSGTISTYIRRHKELFDGHIEKTGSNINLDEEAIRLLELIYPLPKPIQTIENPETQKKYIRALEQINYLQNELLKLKSQLQESNSIKLLFQKQENELEELKLKYDKLKNRGFWDRIMNKNC